MKKALFLIICIAYGLSTRAQQTVALNDAVSIGLPNGVHKINKEQALAHASKKFRNNKTVVNAISKRNGNHMYMVDDVLITLNVDDHSVDNGHLLEMKKGMDDLMKTNITYSSTIKKNTNNSVLILNYIMGNMGYYRLYAYNINNTRATTGILEFDKADATEASTILDHILKNLKFNK